MVSPYVAVGAARGLEDARRRIRAERQQDEDRTEQKTELQYMRDRRGVVDAREDDEYQHNVSQRPLRERALNAQVTSAETTAEGAKTELGWRKEDRPQQVESNRLGLEAAKADFEHAKTSRVRQNEEQDMRIKKIRQDLQEEGLDRMLDALEGGAAPEYAVKLFNSQGKNGIRPGTLNYDKQTGAVSFTGRDGEQFNGTVSQLRSLLPAHMRTTPRKLTKVTQGGALYDELSGQWITPPAGKGLMSGGRGVQKLSPFNPQKHGKDTRDLVIQGLGGEWDNQLQKFKIPQGMGEKISYGTSLADQVVRLSEEEGMQLGPGEVANVVNSVMRNVRTTGEAMRAAKSELGDNTDETSIQTRAQEIVNDSKIKAAQALKAEMDILRSNAQQQQNSQSWPQGPDTSPDMEGGGDGMETPPLEMLREGYAQPFQDGSVWTLQDGRAVRVQ
jgi:hypothetical protein